MARNRITYNVQDLFFGPPSGEISEIAGYHLLKQIDGVQSVNYDFNITRAEIGVLGKSQNAARQVIEPPSISIDFSYLLNGITNEKRMGLNVASDGTTPAVPFFFDNYFNENRTLDSRNIYLVTNLSELDVREQNIDYIFSSSDPLLIEDQRAFGYGILAFQNSYVSNYSVDISIGSLPKANVSLVADNAIFYSSGSGVHVPRLNTRNGTVYSDGTKILIPKHELSNFTRAFRPGDITVNIQRTASATDAPISFETDKIQSFGFEVPLNRENVSYFGHKLYADRPLTLPIKSNINLGLLAGETFSGSFLSNLNRDDEYNLTVVCKTSDGSVGIRYGLSGAKFDSASYSSAIGENKTSDLKFSVDLDFDNKIKGIFISGQAKTFREYLVDDSGEIITSDQGYLYYQV